MENPVKLSRDEIRTIYSELFMWESFYRHINNLATVEGLPAHAKSVLVRLEPVRNGVNILEIHWNRIGFDYQSIKEEVREEYNQDAWETARRVAKDFQRNGLEVTIDSLYWPYTC